MNKADLPFSSVIISPIFICRPHKYTHILTYVIPGNIRNIMSKYRSADANARRHIDDTNGIHSIDDAIIDIEKIASGIICKIKSNDLLFVFSHTIDGINNFMSKPIFFNPVDNITEYSLQCPDYTNGKTGKKGKSNPLIIILFKLKQTEGFNNVFRQQYKQQNYHGESQEISWRFKDNSCQSSENFIHTVRVLWGICFPPNAEVHRAGEEKP